jgi:hypothetical protein
MRRDVRDGGRGPATYQSILGPLLVEMWHSQLGIALAGGAFVDTWTGQIAGTVLQAPGASARPAYGTDGANFSGKNAVKFAGGDDSLQIVNAATPLYNVARPSWMVVYRHTTAASVTECIVSVVDNPVTVTIPTIFRDVADKLRVQYFGFAATTIGTTNMGTTVHFAEGLIRSSDSRVISAVDGTDTVGAVATAVNQPAKSIYFGNDRGANPAVANMVLALALNDSASTLQRAAILALARAEWGF